MANAPFFNRIKLWRKFGGHAVYGLNTSALEGGRGRAIAITPKTLQQKRPFDIGPGAMGRGVMPSPYGGPPPSMYQR